MKKILLIVFASLGLCFAGRPLKTTDAFSLGKNYFQIEFASDAFAIENNYFLLLPTIFTYGVNNHTDVQLGFAIIPSERKFAESLNLGVKQHLFTSVNIEAAFTLGFITTINNSRFLDPAGYLNLLSSITLNDFILHCNMGYSQNLNENEYKDIWFSSLGLEYALTDNFSLAADVGLNRSAALGSPPLHYYSLAGFSYKLTENFILDTGVNFCYEQNLVDLITAGVTIKL